MIRIKHESDPNGLNPHDEGSKLDAGKVQASLLEDFSLALMAVAQVATYGAAKYTVGGWQQVPDGIKRYTDAEWRHRLAKRHEELDPESGLPHEYHELWNMLAKVEMKLRLKMGSLENDCDKCMLETARQALWGGEEKNEIIEEYKSKGFIEIHDAVPKALIGKRKEPGPGEG